MWSHDGTKVMFAAGRSGRFDLYEKNADGSGEERLLVSSDQNKYPTSASPDGRFLLFASNGPNGQDDLWVLPLDGERKPFVFLNTEAHETQGQFSPNQRWITYQSMTSGIPHVFVRPFSPAARSAAGATGSQWIISANGGSFPRWSANGKRLFYVAMNSELMAVDVQTGISFGHGASQRLFGTVPPGPWSPSPRRDWFLVSADRLHRRSAATHHDGAELDDEARAVRVTPMPS